jgi:glycosyltransferase involved in cell wall biosynthesis
VSAGRTVRVVVPAGIDDPGRPSGGNTYDRRVCEELAATGWSVDVRQVPGAWPRPRPGARDHLAAALGTAPDGSVLLVDGLVGLAAPEVVVPAGRRLRTVVLVHLPGGTAAGDLAAPGAERAVLSSAAAVVTTSQWARSRLIARHGLQPARVHVAAPGVDPAPPAAGSHDGGRLLCVGAVIPAKGHDLLLTALAAVADRSWRCVCAGSLDRAPAFVSALRRAVLATGLDGRIAFTGPLGGPALDDAYAAADVLVLPTRAESYGMVVGEALARGLPVLASDVGGVPEALGTTAAGRPGLLTPAGDVAALAASLRRWLDDAGLRARLQRAAHRRRADQARWAATAGRVARVLEDVAA